MTKYLMALLTIGVIPIQGVQIHNLNASEQRRTGSVEFDSVFRKIFSDYEINDKADIIPDTQYMDTETVTSKDNIDSQQMHTEKYATYQTNDAYYSPKGIQINFQDQINGIVQNQLMHGISIQKPGRHYVVYKIGFLPRLSMQWKEWHYQDINHEVYNTPYVWFSANLDNQDLTNRKMATGSPKLIYSTRYEITESHFGDKITFKKFRNAGCVEEDPYNKFNHHFESYTNDSGQNIPAGKGIDSVIIGFKERLHSEFKHTYAEEDLYPSSTTVALKITAYGGWVKNSWIPPTINSFNNI